MKASINWGILSTANIGLKKVIPAMQLGSNCTIVAIASRNLEKAKKEAENLNIPTAYGNYEDLINDPSIDAIYNPLPNHLHFETTMQCIKAGKHVLCEKPMVLTVEEVKTLIKARDEHNVKVGEAFMVHTHPQWIKAKELITEGFIGELKAVHGFFSYYNVDAQNIRNIADYGGGALWDIGCYPIHTSRLVIGKEPHRVTSLLTYDPKFKTDIVASVLLDFPSVQVSFTAATQLKPFQTMQFFGTEKTLTVEVPFNAPDNQACRILINEGDILKQYTEVNEIPICNQYTLQGESFSAAILNDQDVPVPLENTLYNTAILNAIYQSGNSGNWEKVEV